ncbi:hypothetical protein CAEBREN_17888 [Caenorhabditis brenneri]|uniref:RRM domain-containing protein n=1 Tax=Caenorhabditis brenneri TaxID=135651 RepID=G0PDF8_CAEBE|nr:hypothetical protein CAEBREN_26166 [Caenorhabditis brenneri]EGT56306.1 hypothetical protein CAEBREN_17888 [Caenorhabditis brenneri]
MSRGGGDRRAAPDIGGLTSLKIDNLSYQTTPNDLRRVFERYGDIGDVHIPRDKYSRQSKGFGFVRFYERRDAEHAMDRTDGKNVDGRELRVTLAKYDRPSDERGGRGGGGGGRRGRSRSPRRRSRSPRYSRSRSPRRSRSRTRSPPSRDRRDSPDRRNRSPSHSRSRSPLPRDDSPPPKSGRSRSRSASRSPSRSRSNSR